MKRQILTLGAICAAAFTLTNCNKEIAEPKAPVTEGIPFEIVATTADTKTANDGLNTVWTTGDALNVFHAEAGSTAYENNDEFTYTGAGNKFTGKLKTALGGGNNYDWYALYPYNKLISTPTGKDKKYTLIGKKNGPDTGDTQDGNDSKAHLSGKSCPMYAVAKNVAASDVPTLTMKHLTSVVAVTVTNANDDPLTVNSVSFSAPEGTLIFGSFFINFTENGDPVYTKHTNTGYTSNTSNLTVKNGTPIAKNGKATFYLAIKPFAAKVGDELKISVNGYEKTHKLTKDVEFKAGKIEAVNFKYDAAPVPGTTVALGPDWNSIFGTSYSGSFNPKTNALSLSGTVTDVTINVKNGKSTNGYIKSEDFRAYNGYTIVLSVPAGKSITKINTTKGGKTFTTGISADSGTTEIKNNSLSWTGSSQNVTLTISGTVSFNTISVTYE